MFHSQVHLLVVILQPIAPACIDTTNHVGVAAVCHRRTVSAFFCCSRFEFYVSRQTYPPCYTWAWLAWNCKQVDEGKNHCVGPCMLPCQIRSRHCLSGTWKCPVLLKQYLSSRPHDITCQKTVILMTNTLVKTFHIFQLFQLEWVPPDVRIQLRMVMIAAPPAQLSSKSC